MIFELPGKFLFKNRQEWGKFFSIIALIFDNLFPRTVKNTRATVESVCNLA